MFSDLECDYINPIDLCNKLNQVRMLSTFAIKSTWRSDSNTSARVRTVCLTRKRRSRILDVVIPSLRPMDCVPPQRTTRRLQRQQVRLVHHFVFAEANLRFLRIMNKTHMYDATEIFRTLSGHKKEAFVKLGFYLLSFFYYLYRCVHVFSAALHHANRDFHPE